MRSIGVAVPLTLILSGFLSFMACTGGAPNTNREASNTNGTQSAANTNGTQSAAADPASPMSNPCDKPTVAARLSDLQTMLHDPNVNTGDRELNAQRLANHFDFKVDPDPVWGISLKVRGKISRDDSSAPKMRKLVMFIDKFMRKGCVQRVSFESMTAASAGFGWTICEDPERPCPPPDGQCAHCMGNVNSNVNRNPTPPANTNSNVREIPNRSNQSNTNSGP